MGRETICRLLPAAFDAFLDREREILGLAHSGTARSHRSAVVTPSLRDRVRGIATPVALAMGRVGLTPNALTLIGFAGTCVAAILAAVQAWLPAGILVLVFGAFDMFDGTLARATGKARSSARSWTPSSTAGAKGSSTSASSRARSPPTTRRAPILAAAAMASAFMVSYARAKSEGLGFTGHRHGRGRPGAPRDPARHPHYRAALDRPRRRPRAAHGEPRTIRSSPRSPSSNESFTS